MSIYLVHNGVYNGFPRDIVDRGELAQGAGPLRNGQRARALPISALEQASQYLAAGRSLSIPALTWPLVFGSGTLLLGRVPLEVFRRHVTFFGFASSDGVDHQLTFSVRLVGAGAVYQTVVVQGTETDTIEDAERFVIAPSDDDFITAAAASDVPTSDNLELTVSSTGGVSTATLWSLTMVVEPATVIP